MYRYGVYMRIVCGVYTVATLGQCIVYVYIMYKCCVQLCCVFMLCTILFFIYNFRLCTMLLWAIYLRRIGCVQYN